MTSRAPHAHVVVQASPEEVVLIRRVRNGREYFVAPGVAVADGETPGVAAARAAREELGIEVVTGEMVHAQVFAGVDHFFFMATAQSEPPADQPAPDHDDFELDSELDGSYEIVRVRVKAILGHDVRPLALARQISSLSGP